MVSNHLVNRFGELQSSLGEEVLQELGIVENLKFAPDLRILMFQGMETMRTEGQNLFDIGSFHRFDIAFCQCHEEILVSHPPRRITTAPFLGSKDPESDAAGLQNLDQGRCNLLISRIEAACTSDPE